MARARRTLLPAAVLAAAACGAAVLLWGPDDAFVAAQQRGEGAGAVAAAAAANTGAAAAAPSAPAGAERRALLRAGVAGLAAVGQAAVAKEDRVATFRVELEGDDNGFGEIKVRLRPDWAPRGVKRFEQLSRIGDLEDAAVYHVTGQAAHFGLPASPSLEPAPIKDDIVRAENKRGTLTFKPSGMARVNEMFFNKEDNTWLDRQGYAPIGEVVEGMDVVDRLYAGYGKRPNRHDIKMEGNKYLDEDFPKLSKIVAVEVSA